MNSRVLCAFPARKQFSPAYIRFLVKVFREEKHGGNYPETMVGVAGTPFMMAIFGILLILRLALGLVGRGAFDEINFHKPVIDEFFRTWPNLDFQDYLSATTPGFHVLLASSAKLVGANISFLSSFLTSLLFAPFGSIAFLRLVRRPTSQKDVFVAECLSCALLLPLVCSPYVLASGIWILPDNFAWVLLSFLLAFILAGFDYNKFPIVPAILLLLLVFVRQIHLWAAAPIVAAAFCLPAFSANPLHHPLANLKALLSDQFKKRVGYALIAGILTFPSFFLVYKFMKLWGGFTPPTFQGQYPIDPSKPLLLRLFNAPAAPAFILALFGVFGIFYAGFWFPSFLRAWKNPQTRIILCVAATLALLLSLVPSTTYSVSEGRFSGLWNIALKVPSIAGHTSPLILSLAVLGSLIFTTYLWALSIRHALVCLVATAGFAAAQAASFQLWQRYSEPFVLIMLILMTIFLIAPMVNAGKTNDREATPSPQPDPLLADAHASAPVSNTSNRVDRAAGLVAFLIRFRFAGPAFLGLALAVLSWSMFAKAPLADFYDLKPGEARTKAFLKGDPSIKPVPLPTK